MVHDAEVRSQYWTIKYIFLRVGWLITEAGIFIGESNDKGAVEIAGGG